MLDFLLGVLAGVAATVSPLTYHHWRQRREWEAEMSHCPDHPGAEVLKNPDPKGQDACAWCGFPWASLDVFDRQCRWEAGDESAFDE